jgi:hypothetical protein
MKGLLTVLLLLTAGAARGATPAPGWALHAIPTPGTASGGVVRSGDAILVGQGDYGAQTVIRLDGAGATTIATGFGSLGGFDLDAAGTLYVVDNCTACPGTTSGDSVYAIPNALARTTAIDAAAAEVLPAGSIPDAQEVLALPDGSLLVSDDTGNGAGRVLKVAGGIATVFIPGLDLPGGIARAADGSLRVANAVLNPDFSTTGELLEYASDGTFQSTVVSGLDGVYGAAFDADGNVLVTGAGPFGAKRLVAVAPDGSLADRATGFSFPGDVFFDAARNEALVLDFGLTEIEAVCRDVDGNATCDADQACVAGVTVAKVKLALGKLDAPGGDDTLSFKGELTLADTSGLDPATNGIRIVVTDANAAVVVDAALPGGGSWKAKNGTFKYQDDAGAIGGVQKATVKLSAKHPGLVRFAVAGKKGTYAAAPDALPLAATAVVGPAPGECGDVAFPGPAPAPACVAKKAGVKCG